MAAKLILIIEDDAHIGGLVSEVLREAGYLSVLSPSVDAARAQAAEGLRPDAIISDLVVDGAEGPATLAREIDAIFTGVPLTLMTGVPPKRRAHLGVTHDRILEKPFELEGLLQAVVSMLGKGSAK
jgi:DNA-binding NtrC family response regulator